MKIYLVAGKSGSGKGEVAKIINEYYLSLNQKPIITSFSKYIKMYAKEIIGWDGNEPKPRKFLQDLGVTIKENMDMVINKIDIEGVEIMMPESGYLLWVKLDKVNDVDKFILELAKEKKVLLETGSRFINDYEGFVRINVATSKSILEEAMDRFVDFYKEYK